MGADVARQPKRADPFVGPNQGAGGRKSRVARMVVDDNPLPVDVGADERRAQALVEDLQIRPLVKRRRDAERDGRGNAPQTPVMNAKSH